MGGAEGHTGAKVFWSSEEGLAASDSGDMEEFIRETGLGPTWIQSGHLKAGPGKRAAVRKMEGRGRQSSTEALGTLRGVCEEGLCAGQGGRRSQEERRQRVADTCPHRPGEGEAGSGGVSYPEKRGERMELLHKHSGGLSGSWESGPGAHKPTSFFSHSPRFSSLFHCHSPRLRSLVLQFLLFFSIYMHLVTRSW